MTTKIALLTDPANMPAGAAALGAPWAAVAATSTLASRIADLTGDVVLVVRNSPLTPEDEEALRTLALTVPVLLAGPTVAQLAQAGALDTAAGVQRLAATPIHAIRVRPDRRVDPRAEGDLLLTDSFLLVDKAADDVQILATANVAFADHAVLTWRPSTGVGTLTLGSRGEVWEDPHFMRLIRRWIDHATRRTQPAPLRVGMLGYGAIGHEHGRAFLEVPGFTLAGVCDRASDRVEAARSIAPDVRSFDHGDAMLASPDIDLVVVSTPPDTHAKWAAQALDAGKHVMLEKPMALTTADCDAVLSRADDAGLTAVVYQNRRWDPDYLALRRLVRSGALGEVFHVESFVGGYGHPCNYWHSDAAISGGAIFDWGSHYIDQLLELLPRRVAQVTANNHKRVWHDVTNADHSRVTLRFDDGTEAEFVHSDIAAALKPKWYVLGTEGAVVGHWRTERVVSRNEIGTMVDDTFAPADSPADLDFHAADGSITRLAAPAAPRHAFHRELASHVLDGFTMTIDPRQSRDVVAVMEAAEASALAGGTPVVPA